MRRSSAPTIAHLLRRIRLPRAGLWRSICAGCLAGVLIMTGIWLWPSHASPASAHSATPSVGADLSAFFGPHLTPRKGGSFGLDHASVHRSTGTPFPYYLRVNYPRESSSVLASSQGDGVSAGGAQLYLTSDTGPVDAAYLRYYIRIPTGFQWVKGGKLPGLYGGTVTSGRKIPNGENGLSTRYMWRAGGAGEVYAYLPTSKEHGTSLGRGDWHWPTGRWACVEQQVTLNDPGTANGKVNVWLDGHQVLAKHSLTFRDADSLNISGLFFSTFFGGGDKTWATPISQHVDFADFVISHNRIGCEG